MLRQGLIIQSLAHVSQVFFWALGAGSGNVRFGMQGFGELFAKWRPKKRAGLCRPVSALANHRRTDVQLILWST